MNMLMIRTLKFLQNEQILNLWRRQPVSSLGNFGSKSWNDLTGGILAHSNHPRLLLGLRGCQVAWCACQLSQSRCWLCTSDFWACCWWPWKINADLQESKFGCVWVFSPEILVIFPFFCLFIFFKDQLGDMRFPWWKPEFSWGGLRQLHWDAGGTSEHLSPIPGSRRQGSGKLVKGVFFCWEWKGGAWNGMIYVYYILYIYIHIIDFMYVSFLYINIYMLIHLI